MLTYIEFVDPQPEFVSTSPVENDTSLRSDLGQTNSMSVSVSVPGRIVQNLKSPHNRVRFFEILFPLLVLILEFFMLYRMLVEQKERKKTNEALSSFRTALGRENYLDQISLAIRTAENDVVFTTSTMEASWHSVDQKKIFEAVKERFKRPPFMHRGIVAEKPGALAGTIELACLTDVQIRMSPTLAMSRLRFLVRDSDRSVIGIADGRSELAREQPSSVGLALDSTMLAVSLRARFDVLWGRSSDPFEYLSKFINEAKTADEPHTQKSILLFLLAHKSDLKAIHEALLRKCEAYKDLPPIDPEFFKEYGSKS